MNRKLSFPTLLIKRIIFDMIEYLNIKYLNTLVLVLLGTSLVAQAETKPSPISSQKPRISDTMLVISLGGSEDIKEITKHRFGKNLRLFKSDLKDSPTLGAKINRILNPNDKWIILIGTENTATELIKYKKQIIELIDPKVSNNIILFAINPVTQSVSDKEILEFKDRNSFLVGVPENTASIATKNSYVEKSQEYLNWLADKHNYSENGIYNPEYLWMVARAILGIISPSTLKLKILTETSEANSLRHENIQHSELFQKMTNTINIPIDKEPVKGMYGAYGYEDIAMGTITYPNWSVDEILRFQLKATKWAIAKNNLQIQFISWIELLKEVTPKISNLPESFSNKQRWLEQGLTIRKQDGDNCGWYSHATALDAVLINKGYKNPKISAHALENRNNNNFGSVGNILKAATSGPITGGDGVKYDVRNLTVRSCRGFPMSVNHTDFPVWLRKKIKRENKLLSSEWKIINQELIKHEIANGRPVVLSTSLPDAKSFKNPSNQTLDGDIVIRRGFIGKNYYPHGVVLSGYKPDPKNPNETLFEFINSWGPNWGNKGSAWISSCYINIMEIHETRAYSLSLE
jgi:hypothetical protein